MMDQLDMVRARGDAFVGMQEGTICWPPTFKVRREAGCQYKAKRLPSYCDRVLWHSMAALTGCLAQTEYRSIPSVSTSDHKPVVAAFELTEPLPLPRLQPLRSASASSVYGPSPASSFTNGNNRAIPSSGPFRLHLRYLHLTRILAADLGGTSDPYCLFFTSPPGLLEGVPRTPVKYYVPGVASNGAAGSTWGERLRKNTGVGARAAKPMAVQWEEKDLPLLKLRVRSAADLERVALIVAVFDKDRGSQDDALGTVTLPLSAAVSSFRKEPTAGSRRDPWPSRAREGGVGGVGLLPTSRVLDELQGNSRRDRPALYDVAATSSASHESNTSMACDGLRVSRASMPPLGDSEPVGGSRGSEAGTAVGTSEPAASVARPLITPPAPVTAPCDCEHTSDVYSPQYQYLHREASQQAGLPAPTASAICPALTAPEMMGFSNSIPAIPTAQCPPCGGSSTPGSRQSGRRPSLTRAATMSFAGVPAAVSAAVTAAAPRSSEGLGKQRRAVAADRLHFDEPILIGHASAAGGRLRCEIEVSAEKVRALFWCP